MLVSLNTDEQRGLAEPRDLAEPSGLADPSCSPLQRASSLRTHIPRDGSIVSETLLRVSLVLLGSGHPLPLHALRVPAVQEYSSTVVQ